MSVVKSLAVGDGDMFYIRHDTDNFTMIDCCMDPGAAANIIAELKAQSKDKTIRRFISTHPDQDHLTGLVALDDAMDILNFYCVANKATKPDSTDDFERYCQLRDHPQKAFHLFRDCSRLWMNKSNEERGNAGIDILWPITTDPDYKQALQAAKDGESPNNISCILTYSLSGGATMAWMGDLETDFMEAIQDSITLRKINILFAPHHGRDSGKVPGKWLEEMSPDLVVIGEAPSEHLNYYAGYDTITQNSTGEIVFECVTGKTHVYVENEAYSTDCLNNEGRPDKFGRHYIGTLPM